jgi:alkylhydroperoxidase family enzyme
MGLEDVVVHARELVTDAGVVSSSMSEVRQLASTRGRVPPKGRLSPVVRIQQRLARRAFRKLLRRPVDAPEGPAVIAHVPLLAPAYALLEAALMRGRALDPRLAELARARAATVHGCPWWLDVGSAVGRAVGVPEEKLRALAHYRDSDLFDELERRVLDFATAASRSPADVPDELRETLRAELGDGGLVQLAAIVAVENFLGRFNRGVGVEAQGYAAGAACLVPERP